jgi:hypothetical protein
MNIFILDYDPELAAQMLCDKHVVKMALETAQILSTINNGPYKPTHENHPCVKWARSGADNYQWLVKHGVAICNEYRYRYGKEHKCEETILALQQPLYNITIQEGSSPYVQCMPDKYRHVDPVQAYRTYYRATKSSFAKWTKREKPLWWNSTYQVNNINPVTIKIDKEKKESKDLGNVKIIPAGQVIPNFKPKTDYAASWMRNEVLK